MREPSVAATAAARVSLCLPGRVLAGLLWRA